MKFFLFRAHKKLFSIFSFVFAVNCFPRLFPRIKSFYCASALRSVIWFTAKDVEKWHAFKTLAGKVNKIKRILWCKVAGCVCNAVKIEFCWDLLHSDQKHKWNEKQRVINRKQKREKHRQTNLDERAKKLISF
jgi:hypothetical protein